MMLKRRILMQAALMMTLTAGSGMVQIAAAQNTTVSTQTPANQATPGMSKDELKAQKKQQKKEEKAANAQAKAAKSQAKAKKASDDAVQAQQKANPSAN